jgi:hypothetical protein
LFSNRTNAGKNKSGFDDEKPDENSGFSLREKCSDNILRIKSFNALY